MNISIYSILAICGIVYCFGYLIAFKKSYGFWPSSFSASFKTQELDKDENGIGKGYRFTKWIAFMIIFMLPGLLHNSNTALEWVLGYGSLFYLAIVGAKPSGINEKTTKIHCWAAKLCALSAVVWVALQHCYLLLAIFLIGGFVWSRLWQRKYETLIMELMAFLATYGAIIQLN